MKNLYFIIGIILLQRISAQSQTIDTILFTFKSEYDFSFLYSAYTSEFDKMGRPYVYAACRELGVVTFDISNIDEPFPTDTISIAKFLSLRPTNLKQYDNFLFVALGGFDGLIPQNPGLAIINIEDPENPVVADVWSGTDYNQGCAIVISDGTYAYLGAMDEGIIILDVSDKEDIQFVSHLLPDPDFPDVPDLFTTPNARGLYKLNESTLLVANDHGGLRWIDISDIEEPVETGKYINSELYATAASAYNNVAVKDNYAYVPVDYCGLDVIDVNDSDMENVVWLNPWDCNTTNWIGRPGHTNEVKIIDNILFLSGGDSEVLAYDISAPSDPKLKGSYAFPYDSIVAWSLDIYDNYVSLALVNNSVFGIPYYSNVGGISLLQYEVILHEGVEQIVKNIFSVTPVPFNNYLSISSSLPFQETVEIRITNMQGSAVCNEVFNQFNSKLINTQNLLPGIYCLTILSSQEHFTKIIVK